MKFSCLKELLQNAVNNTQKAVSSKSSSPVFEGILVEANEIVTLTGNDLELCIQSSVVADISRTGSVILNARMFGDIVRRANDGMITIDTNEKNMTVITSGSSVFEIAGISADQYPMVPFVEEEEEKLIMKSDVLKSMIRQTIFAISMGEHKQILTGSLFEMDEDMLHIVSVDGYRMAVRREKPVKSFMFKPFVVPGKTLSEILKILDSQSDDISIYPAHRHVMFDMPDCKVISRILEGEFINYKNIIPKEGSLKFSTDVRKFSESVDRASLIITSETVKSPLKIEIKGEKLIISCITVMGRVHDEVKIDPLFGEQLEIGFNHRYLSDALKSCETEKVFLEFTTSLSPLVITPMEGEKFLHMILPVRLKG